MQNNVACITASCHTHYGFPRLAQLDPIQYTRTELCFYPHIHKKTLMIVSLDYLEKKDGWPILHRLREDLQKIAIVIGINQNLQFLQLCQVLLNLQSYLNHHFLLVKF